MEGVAMRFEIKYDDNQEKPNILGYNSVEEHDGLLISETYMEKKTAVLIRPIFESGFKNVCWIQVPMNKVRELGESLLKFADEGDQE